MSAEPTTPELKEGTTPDVPVIRSSSALFANGSCRICGFRTTATGRGASGSRSSHYAKHLRAGELRRRSRESSDAVTELNRRQ